MFVRSKPTIEHKNVGSFLAFNKEFFERHQRKLLWLLNNKFTSRWFKWVLRIRKDDVGYDREIEWVKPNAYAVKGNKPGELIADFRTHPKYGKRIYHAFKPIWWLMHFWDWLVADRVIPEWSFGFSTLTAYPDPDPETTTVDGTVRRQAVDEVFSTLRNGAGNSSSDNSSPNTAFNIVPSATTDQWARIDRFICLFDTSSLTSGATISAASLSVYGVSKANDSSISPDMNVYASTPASNTALVNADFSQLGTTAFATAISYASIATGAYNDFSLNGTGLAAISKTGVSKFGIRNANYDVANSAPTWAAPPADNRLVISSAEEMATSQDPKLVVTYTTSIDVTVSPAVQAATFSIAALSVLLSSILAPSAQSSVFSVPTLTVKADQVLSQNVQSATFSIPLVTFSNATSVTVSPSAQSSTFTTQSPGVLGNALTLPNTQNVNFSIPSLSLITSSVLSIATQIISFSVQIPARLGAFYNDKYERQNTSYTNKYSSQGTSYSDLYTPRNF